MSGFDLFAGLDNPNITLRVQVVLIYGFWAPKTLNNDYLDP